MPSLDQFNALPIQTRPPSDGQFQNPVDPNRQDRKEAFLSRDVDTEIYNPSRLQTPVSPYQVMAGTIIPASLVTGLNSDLYQGSLTMTHGLASKRYVIKAVHQSACT